MIATHTKDFILSGNSWSFRVDQVSFAPLHITLNRSSCSLNSFGILLYLAHLFHNNQLIIIMILRLAMVHTWSIV